MAKKDVKKGVNKDVNKGVLNIGFGNVVVRSRLVAILSPGPSPVRRLRKRERRADSSMRPTDGSVYRYLSVTPVI